MALARGQRILLVDDEPDILSALRDFLAAKLGVEVVMANSGTKALAAMDAGQIDLIITDYRMPGMDGLELLRQVAARAPDVPRVLMTAFPEVDLAITALNDGRILHFLSKPLAPAELVTVVEAILDERRAKLQRQAALHRSLARLRHGSADPKESS